MAEWNEAVWVLLSFRRPSWLQRVRPFISLAGVSALVLADIIEYIRTIKKELATLGQALHIFTSSNYNLKSRLSESPSESRSQPHDESRPQTRQSTVIARSIFSLGLAQVIWIMFAMHLRFLRANVKAVRKIVQGQWKVA